MITTNVKWAALPVVAALACSGAALSAEDGKAALMLPASDFAPMQRINIAYDDPKDMAELYVRTLGLSARDAEYEEGRNPRDTRNKVVIATVKGINDPQVNAIQWRIEMKSEGGNWEAVKAGLRRKCQNGPDANTWTKELCP